MGRGKPASGYGSFNYYDPIEDTETSNIQHLHAPRKFGDYIVKAPKSGKVEGVDREVVKSDYTPDDLLPLSGIQHFLFCRRQWALIHVEQ